ncbi:MAG TPA: hypothetical protein VIS71_00380 [Terrimicrobium sp.]
MPSMAASTACEIPLVDEALGDELFAPQEDPDLTRMQREVWREVRKGIEPDLMGAARGEPENLKAHLHRIRGYCSSCALRRLEKVLLAWESQPCAADAAERYAQMALEATSLSIVAIESRYPHLKPGPANTSQ